MVNADVLTFREFMMREPLPLARLHNAVLEFLRDRDDVVVFGAQAVTAYVSEPRMTQDIVLLSTRAEAVAQELCDYLRRQFHIAVRIRRVGEGRGLRLFQVRKSGTDWRDLAMLLLTFPALKHDPSLVTDRLRAADSGPEVLASWKELVAQEIRSEDEDDDF